MNRSHEITVWYDSYYNQDRAIAEVFEGVQSVREIPCDEANNSEGCIHASTCEKNATDCRASRNWYYGNGYDDADIGVGIRGCK